MLNCKANNFGSANPRKEAIMPEKQTAEISEKAADKQPDNSKVAEAQALKELKEQVEALKAENEDLNEAKRKYYDTVLNETQPKEENAPQHRTPEEIRKELFDGKTRTNLDYAKLAVELDDALLRNGEQSCFIPSNPQDGPTANEVKNGELCRKSLEEAIEKADGDPARFNLEINR